MQACLIFVRALHFWAVAVLIGGSGYRQLLGRPFRGDVTILRVAAICAAVFGFAWFLVVFVEVSGDPASLFDRDIWAAFFGAPFGPPWAIRLALLAAGCAIVPIANARAYFALGLALAVDQVWLGHAATSTGATALVAMGADAVHVFAGFAWVGALVMLSAESSAVRRVPRDGLALFSTIGIALVITLLASGIVNMSFRIGGPRDLVTSPYGLFLSTKIALFATMVGLAILNRQAARRNDRSDRHLTGSVVMETVMGLAVLVAAAALGVTAPPR